MRKMIALVFFLLFHLDQTQAQQKAFATYRLLPLDSVTNQLPRTFRSIQTTKEPLRLTLNDKTYSFVSTPSDTSANSYPELTAGYDDTYELKILEWELKNVNPSTLTFDVYLARFHKQTGAKKGKVYVSPDVLVDRSAVKSVYLIDQVDKPHKNRVSLLSIGVGALVIALAVILL